MNRVKVGGNSAALHIGSNFHDFQRKKPTADNSSGTGSVVTTTSPENTCTPKNNNHCTIIRGERKESGKASSGTRLISHLENGLSQDFSPNECSNASSALPVEPIPEQKLPMSSTVNSPTEVEGAPTTTANTSPTATIDGQHSTGVCCNVISNDNNCPVSCSPEARIPCASTGELGECRTPESVTGLDFISLGVSKGIRVEDLSAAAAVVVAREKEKRILLSTNGGNPVSGCDLAPSGLYGKDECKTEIRSAEANHSGATCNHHNNSNGNVVPQVKTPFLTGYLGSWKRARCLSGNFSVSGDTMEGIVQCLVFLKAFSVCRILIIVS